MYICPGSVELMGYFPQRAPREIAKRGNANPTEKNTEIDSYREHTGQ
jgi:hypothetical protein